jgi:micrococcal nuclease
MNYFFEKYKIFFAIIIGAVIIGAFIYFGLKKSNIVLAPGDKAISLPQDNNTKENTCLAHDNSFVTKVIDGDTVVVEGGYHVRLLGMDADEKGYPCYESAKTRLEDLVLGKMVKLEKDKTDLDQYGRCLRYIFLGSTNIDVQLVKEGLAVARFYNPDIKYKTEIADAEKQAQQSLAGCKWSGNPQAEK